MIMLTCFKVGIRFMEFPNGMVFKNPHVFEGAVSFRIFFSGVISRGKTSKTTNPTFNIFFSRNGSVDFLKELLMPKCCGRGVLWLC